MKAPLFLLVILVVLSCSDKQKNRETTSNHQSPKTLTYQDGPYTFEVSIDSIKDESNANCTVKSISIFDKSTHELVQRIVPPENTYPNSMKADEMFFTDDINFDGYNDFRIIQFLPASPNVPFYYWVFDSKTKTFLQDTTLAEVTSPIFDAKAKTISCYWRSGCCNHVTNIYKYINHQLTMIEQTEETAINPDNSDSVVVVHKKLIDGELKTVETKRTVGDGNEH